MHNNVCWQGLIDDGGFKVTHTDVDLLVVPSGYLTIVAANTSRWIRWSIAGDEADRVRTETGLQSMLDSFPEVRQPASGYQQFRDFLAAV